MAQQLTGPQITTLIAMLATFNGDVNAFQQACLDAYANTQKGAAVTALTGVSVTIADWTAVTTYLASGNPRIITDVIADLNTAVQSNSTANLGPLLMALYAAVKAHFGL